MKKILLIACLLVAATSAVDAQWYVGGNISFSRTSNETTAPGGSTTDNKTTRMMLSPRVGYIINDRWSAGVGVGYQWGKTKDNGDKTATVNGYMATPYARFNCFFFGPFALAAEASAGYSNVLGKSHADDPRHTVRTENIGVAITPVLDLDVSRRISLECRLNFFSVGYTHSKTTTKEGGEKSVAKTNSFGADISGDEIFTLGDLTFGMIFKF